MSKNDNRDNFDPKIKALAAERVGFMCSLCGCLTRAAQLGDEGSTNRGVASHISAAAPGGPRYDPEMTPEERKSIDNCIWLCQTHSKDIDADPKHYTRQYLTMRKKMAEDIVRKAYDDGVSCFRLLQNNNFDISMTKDLIDEAISNGEFLKLKKILDSVDDISQDEDVQDFIDYAKIVYLFYCDREYLKQKLEWYANKSLAKYIDKLVELFIVFMNKEYLQCLIDVCQNDELVRLAKLVLNDELNKIIIRQDVTHENEKRQEKVLEGSVIHKLITNYAIENRIASLSNLDGTDCPFYIGDFYFRQKVSLYNLSLKVFNLYLVKEQKIVDYEEYKEFNNNLVKIKCFVPELQLWFWTMLLSAIDIVEDKTIYEKILSECNEQLRDEFPVQRIIQMHHIDEDVKSVNFEKIRKLSENNNDYVLLHCYLNKLIMICPKDADVIFNRYRYLLEMDCMFLDDYIRIKFAKHTTNFSAVNFLLKYEPIYRDNVLYRILLAFYSSKNKKNKAIFTASSKWLGENMSDFTQLPIVILDKFIEVLLVNKNFEKILEIEKYILPTHIRLMIASILQNTGQFLSDAIRIYESVKREHGNVKGLNKCLFACYYNVGNMNKAKECLMAELDINVSVDNLCQLLSLRLDTMEILFDKYFELAKHYMDAKLLFCVGATFDKARKSEEAYIYFLKSLLIDDNNLDCLNAIMALDLKEVKDAQPQDFNVGVTATLQSGESRIMVTIHCDDILEGIKPNKFLSSYHFKESDRNVEDLVYKTVGDHVSFKNKQYEIRSLVWTSNVINNYAMQCLVKEQRAFALTGNTKEDCIAQITNWMKDRRKYIDDIIKTYNDNKGCVPITIMSSILGRNNLEICDFIFRENNERLKNYYTEEIVDKKVEFVLSLDTIYLLAELNLNESILKQFKCTIPIMTKRIIVENIESISDELKNSSNSSQIYLGQNKLYRKLLTQQEKSERLRFLNSLKRIVESLYCAEEQYYYDYDNQLTSLFIKERLLLEGDLIGYLKHSNNAVLVNDYPFITLLASMHNLKMFGINAFLRSLNIEFLTYIDCLKKLAQLHMGSCITPDVYKYIKNRIMTEKDVAKQNEYIRAFYNFLTASFLKEGTKNWQYHNEIVKDIIKSNNIHAETADGVDRIVMKAFTYIFAKENPQLFAKYVQDVAARFKVKTTVVDDEIMVDTYLDGEDNN